MKFAILLSLATVLSFAEPRALAWSGPGHMIIAAEAYHHLSPALQTRVTEILKAHPDYQKWVASNARAESEMDLPLFIFMRASTWPDEIRRSGGADRQYDHSHWHYIDYPLRPPSFPMEAAPSPEDDVLYGVAQCEKFLSDRSTSPELQAVYLSYLIHLIGDMHQPLHCASLFKAVYPHGDKGGNDFYILPASRPIKLHSFWDQLLGSRMHPQTQLNDAIRIDAEYPKAALPELTADRTPKSWSLESRQLAIDDAYWHGNLKGGESEEAAQPLPEGYTKKAKSVAEKQAALAGYRLADDITRLLK